MNVNEILKSDYAKWYDKPYIYEKNIDTFEPITFGKFIENVTGLAKYLLDNGYKDKKIIIYGENSINWMIADLAIMGYVGISVTIGKEWKYDDVKRTIERLDIDAIFYSNTKKDIINQLKEEYPHIIFYSLQSDLSNMISLQDDIFNLPTKDINKCSKIVFSSGTTSLPKAVMLSLKNMFFGYEALQRRAPMNEIDKIYLFLPLHHTYAGIYNFLYSILSGAKIYLNHDLKEMVTDFQIVKPTIFCGVPLIYERFYNEAKDKLKYIFGPNIKYLFCGGASFSYETRKAYHDAGLNIMLAYALSETASSFSIDYVGSDNLKSVGTIFEELDVKIDNPNDQGEGEIIVKGDAVFLGYYGDELYTKECFDENGYYHTGDIGYIIDNDLYYIKRKDKMICLENGENISPKEIEDVFYEAYNFNKVKVFIKDNVLCANFYVSEKTDISNIVNNVNDKLPKYKRIKKYDVIIDNLNTRYK